jgi:hypothetical protein
MSSVRVDFHLGAPRGERVYNIYMGVEWKENIIHEGPKERTFFQPLLDVWGACACLRWESEKDFIDLSGIKNQVTQEAQLRERSTRAASVSQLSVFCFWERERRRPCAIALRSHLPLSLLCAEIKPF